MCLFFVIHLEIVAALGCVLAIIIISLFIEMDSSGNSEDFAIFGQQPPPSPSPSPTSSFDKNKTTMVTGDENQPTAEAPGAQKPSPQPVSVGAQEPPSADPNMDVDKSLEPVETIVIPDDEQPSAAEAPAAEQPSGPPKEGEVVKAVNNLEAARKGESQALREMLKGYMELEATLDQQSGKSTSLCLTLFYSVVCVGHPTVTQLFAKGFL